jgi:Zn-dependent protease with chaperone function
MFLAKHSFQRNADCLPCFRLEDSALNQIIRDVAAELDAPLPRHVVVGLRPWCFVARRGLKTSSGKVSGPVLYLSLPFLRMLSADELVAVIAHELAHLKYRHFGWQYMIDTLMTFFEIFSAKGCRGRRGIFLLRNLGSRRLRLLWGRAKYRLKLRYEVVADAAGASLSGAERMGAVLEKSSRLICFAGVFERALHDLEMEGMRLVNRSEALVSVLGSLKRPQSVDRVDPLLRFRLRSLRSSERGRLPEGRCWENRPISADERFQILEEQLSQLA